MKARALLGLAVIALFGCSHGQIYEGLRERERSLCAEGPAVQYEECLARIDMDYHEYRKQPCSRH